MEEKKDVIGKSSYAMLTLVSCCGLAKLHWAVRAAFLAL